jgi:hypothetical protein
VSFSRTGSQVLDYSEENKAKNSPTMKKINMFSGQPEPQVIITSAPLDNQVLTHRKSKTMDIPSNG